MTSTAPTVAPDYGLSAPTADAVIDSLANYMPRHEAEAIWQGHCRDAGVRAVGTPPEDLLRVLETMSQQRGLVGVCAMAIKIRARTAFRLAKTAPGGR